MISATEIYRKEVGMLETVSDVFSPLVTSNIQK